MKIRCEKCGKVFTAKLMALDDQAKCVHCGHVVRFCDVRIVRQTNKIFWLGALVLAISSIYWLRQLLGLPDWVVAVAVLLLSVVLIAPMSRLLMCALYNRFRTQ